MLYLGIDQHARQITISLRDDSGDVLQARQVSTRPEKLHEFFTKFTRERIADGESFIAVVEVCGFNDWLIRLLRDYRCPTAADPTCCDPNGGASWRERRSRRRRPFHNTPIDAERAPLRRG